MWRYLMIFLPSLAVAQVDQGRPNADFQPAFANQTRAAALPRTEVITEVFAKGLVEPWGIAPLPDGRFLVTEKPDRMRLIAPNGTLSAPITGLPAVDDRQQGGLLDVAASPRFAQDGIVFWTYAKPVPGGSITAAARGVLSGGEMTQVRDIFLQDPPSRTPKHYGSRIIPNADGTLWITTGEHSDWRDAVRAQDNGTTYGKVIRLNWDGTVPADNPFVGRDGLNSIWSYGHRNIQGAAMGPGGLWTVEHGPRGGDELNRPEAGKNYGWPVVSYGINYNGSDVGQGLARAPGMEEPVYYWDPVIAPGGMAFYDGPFAAWQGHALIASLRPGGLVRLRLQGGRVTGEERLLPDVGRVRDVEVLRDGSVLVLIDEKRGGILRVTPVD